MKTKHLARARFARTSAEGGGGGQQQSGTDGAAGGQQTGSAGSEMAKDEKGNDLFPKNTAVADMSVEHQANYWRTESKKQQKLREDAERRLNNGSQRSDDGATGGSSGTVSNQQTQPDATADAARREGRREAVRDAVIVSMTTALQMRGKSQEEITELLEVVDPGKFVDSDDKIDGTRVANYVARVAPASGNQQQQGLPGQGRQQQQQRPSARESAKAAAERRGLVSTDANRGALGGLRK